MGKRKNGEGSYGEKTIKGTKYKYFRDSEGHYTYGKSMKELKEKIAAKEEKKSKDTIKSNLCTFAEYSEKWLKGIYDDISNGTYDAYESIIKCRIKEYKDYDIADKQIKSLTTDMINSYFKSMAKRYSRGSIDKTWIVIKQVIKYGMKQGDIPQLDLEEVKLPKEEVVAVKKKEIPFIIEEDMDVLFNESKALTSRNTLKYGNASKVIIFIMYSGVRIGEAIGLRWSNVSVLTGFNSVRIVNSDRMVVERDENLEPITKADGTLKYKRVKKATKTKSGERSIPLPDRAIEVLKYFYNRYPHKPDDYVFISGNNTPFDKRGIERTLHRMQNNASNKLSCTDYTPHTLRHGYGSLLISKGVDIKIVSELLGHKDVTTTYNIYIGILKQDKIKAVQNVFNK